MRGHHTTARQQRGMTLVVGLLMLLVMSVLALSSFNISRVSLLAVSNMQIRDEAQAAAQEALDQVISSTLFASNPEAVLSGSTSCPTGTTVTNGICVDPNGDGRTVLKVQLQPTPFCFLASSIKAQTLDITSPNDAGCVLGQSQTFGVVGSTGTGASLCSDTQWQVSAVATDVASAASVRITEAIAVRTTTDAVSSFCP